MRTNLEYTVTKEYDRSGAKTKEKVVAKTYIVTGPDELQESFAQYLDENLPYVKYWFMDDYLEIQVRDTEEKNDIKNAYKKWEQATTAR